MSKSTKPAEEEPVRHAPESPDARTPLPAESPLGTPTDDAEKQQEKARPLLYADWYRTVHKGNS